ncbi:pentatricopeptide repeat-containing protein At1g69290-like [Dipodomys spectabilis]|uniref:pentatricopeptide repeat-containing protein At1g69290-like n=1 Tax=Dipodomys spectabilis TaxID=105255 RepID=UPI001C53866D|nr:pentatricopeptide repeat-containing protein At1g69290-like [Dipodomys spectabilis]
MWRRRPPPVSLLPLSKPFSFSTSTSLYSFLDPSIFSFPKKPPPPPPSPSPSSNPNSPEATQSPITQHQLEITLHQSLLAKDTDLAWRSFKSLLPNTNNPLSNSLITHLASQTDASVLNLKRAFACSVYLIEKNPHVIEFETVRSLLGSMKDANLSAPAFALVKSMLRYRYFMPFSMWGDLLVEISQKSGKGVAFFRVFEECCRVAVEEKVESMRPNLNACNAALAACCYEMASVSDAESIVEKMSVFGLRPDELTIGLLAYLYALKGSVDKVVQLKSLLFGLGFRSRRFFYGSLVSGYVKSGDLGSVLETVLSGLRDEDNEGPRFGNETYNEVVKGFVKAGDVAGLANLITKAQELEPESLEYDKTVGFGIINACVNLGFSDKAHSVVDEMDVQGGSMGLGVYVPILKAYCKEHQTAEATQLVMKISNAGLVLDANSYDVLIEASMASQDFHSAFTLFRDLRESKVEDLKGSYLTIMTGLMENQRPELMAAFLDDVVEDPRVEVKTHDWNSIIHAFCKAGRLEDAKRTFRRMAFLQFEPNDQTYLSLINGYVTGEKYFNVLLLWNEVKRKVSVEKDKGLNFEPSLVDAFLYALVKGGFFDAVMQVVEKSQEMKIFVDKWRYKQAFMETHKKLKVSKLRRRSFRKMEALVAFKNWAGLNA